MNCTYLQTHSDDLCVLVWWAREKGIEGSYVWGLSPVTSEIRLTDPKTSESGYYRSDQGILAAFVQSEDHL